MGQLKKRKRLVVDSGDLKVFVSHCNSNLVQLEFFGALFWTFRSIWFQKFVSRAWLWSFIRWVYGNFFLLPVVFLLWPIYSFFSRLRWTSTNMIYTVLKDSLLTSVINATTPRKPALKSKEFHAAKNWQWRMTWWVFGHNFVRTFNQTEDETAEKTQWLHFVCGIGFWLFSNSQQLYTNFEVRLPPIRTRPT